MIRQVIFKCETCQYTNCLNLGWEGFEPLPCVYESLTDAQKCVMAGHRVVAELDHEQED